MSQQASEDDISQAVLDFLTEGTYPEETVVAAKFPAAALAKELALISQARDQAEAEISSLVRENTFNADDWIVQAKQLHADIEHSRVTAREIVAQHEHTLPLKAAVDDASAKVELIETEIAFNRAVTETLEDVQRLFQQLDAGRTALTKGEINVAIEQFESIQTTIAEDRFFTNTNVISILSGEMAHLREETTQVLRRRWDEQLKFDHQQGVFHVMTAEGADSLENTISLLSRLNIFAPSNAKFQSDFLSTIIDPILLHGPDRIRHSVTVTEIGICVEQAPSNATTADIFKRLLIALNYLRETLPLSVTTTFSQTFIPAIASKAISGWLSTSIPTNLDALDDFENTLDCVLHFTKELESWGWMGYEELNSWAAQAPRLWLTRRRIDSLDSVRKALAASKGTLKQVERVEKERISQADEALLENAVNEWDAGWDEEKKEHPTGQPAAGQAQNDEDEDVSAWGLDEETQDAVKLDTNSSIAESDDAWGWGDEDEDEEVGMIAQPEHATVANPPTENATGHTSSREMTLREVYTVTDIPDSILDIIRQQIVDSEDISHPPHSNSRVASSGAGLLGLPTLILAMFKAMSSSFYSMKLNSGHIYLYNDSMYLAGRVRELVEKYQLPKLNSDVEALEKFGKFAYSKEMQTQGTIVTDLLDGTQGFSQCSDEPFKSECENAVGATVDRIRDVYKDWKPILSHSALLQSIGSLLSTVVGKIIVDIEDLGDISEDQSKQLVSFCNQFSKLEDLFVPESNGDTETVPVTAVYVPEWLRFQYLINMLESSLADIKFLWLEGELSLEFSLEEVIDLVEALFAESDYRRRAIADIRRAYLG